MNGYGNYIRDALAREDKSLTWLGKKLGATSKSPAVQIIEEKRPPRPDEMNVLVRELPISIETLLVKLGINFDPTPESGPVTRLVGKLGRLTPDQIQTIERLVDDLLAKGEER